MPQHEKDFARAIDKQKDQLISWMRWKANKARLQRQGEKKNPLASLQALITKPKLKPKLTEEETFSKLYYCEKIKPVFEAECEREGIDHTNKKARMEVRRRVTKETWMAATQDEVIRNKVTEEQSKRKSEAKQQEERGDEEPREVARQESLKASVVADLPAMFNEVLGNLSEQTGWSFTLLAGRPDYSSGATKTRSISVHVGETKLGMNFVQSYPAFWERVLQPFDSFVRYVHDLSGMVAPRTSETGNAAGALTSTPVISGSASSVGVDNVDSLVTQSGSHAQTPDNSESVHRSYDSDAASLAPSLRPFTPCSDASSFTDTAYHSCDNDTTSLAPRSRPFTPSSDASFADTDNPPHGVYLPLPPEYDGGHFSFNDAESFDPFDEATFARLSEGLSTGLGYGAPSSPPMSHYYAGRRGIQEDLASSLCTGTTNSESSISLCNDGLPTLNPPLISTSLTSAHTPDIPIEGEGISGTSVSDPPLVSTSVASTYMPHIPVQAEGTSDASPSAICVSSGQITYGTSEPMQVTSVQRNDLSTPIGGPTSTSATSVNGSALAQTNGGSQPIIRVLSTMGEAHSMVVQQRETFVFPESNAIPPKVPKAGAVDSSAPRRSGRTMVPSTRNAVANEIGGRGLANK